MAQDFESISLYLLIKIIPERKLNSGRIFVFRDDKYAEFTLLNYNNIASANIQGQEYNGDIASVVDRLLNESNVVALGLGSRKLYEHLQRTGTFEYDGKLPVRYSRGEKSFEVF